MSELKDLNKENKRYMLKINSQVILEDNTYDECTAYVSKHLIVNADVRITLLNADQLKKQKE